LEGWRRWIDVSVPFFEKRNSIVDMKKYYVRNRNYTLVVGWRSFRFVARDEWSPIGELYLHDAEAIKVLEGSAEYKSGRVYADEAYNEAVLEEKTEIKTFAEGRELLNGEPYNVPMLELKSKEDIRRRGEAFGLSFPNLK